MNLARYKNTAALRVGSEVLSASNLATAVQLHHVHEAEAVSPALPLEPLDAVIGECLERFAAYDTAIDSWLTVPLHRALPLSRVQAADPRLWAWLGLAKYPELIEHRWRKKAETGAWPPERLVGSKVRQTFARLWWAAELTVAHTEDYGLTEQLVGLKGFQDVYEAIFGREFCGYLPATSAFIQVVGHKSQMVVRETAKEFSNLLSVSVLESMSEEELKHALDDLSAAVEVRLLG